jgi:hypothetical protein
MGKLPSCSRLGSWSVNLKPKDSVRGIRSRPSSILVKPAANARGLEKPGDSQISTNHVSSSLISKRASTMSTPPSTSSLIALAATITKETEKLDKYLKENGLPIPSFEADAPMDFPKLPAEMKKAREEVVRATKELGDLVTGPREGLRWMAWIVSSHLRFGFLVAMLTICSTMTRFHFKLYIISR